MIQSVSHQLHIFSIASRVMARGKRTVNEPDFRSPKAAAAGRACREPGQ